MIRTANKADINSIIDLHINSFASNHFSAVFSEALLNEYFKKLIFSNKYNYLFFDDNSGKLSGYVIAGFNYKTAVNEFVKENLIKLIWVLIKNPKFLAEKLSEIYRRLFDLGFEPKARCRLYLIAVRDEDKGKGVAKKLISYLEQELIQDGIKDYGLSVRKGNVEAIGFYNKNEYIIEFQKSNSIYYYKKLNNPLNNSSR
jgi:ribosomal protein S18 acetylase RimI-like enzyme